MKKINYILAFFISYLCVGQRGACQVVVNEICSRNGNIIQDEEGDFEDWIELFNGSGSDINLQNYSITDDSTQPQMWIFPDATIKSNGLLTLFASGKNRRTIVNHWETAVFASDQWKYIVPSFQPDSTWALPGYNDAGWFTGTGGIGYGDGDDNTVISPPAWSIYMRRTFFISDTSKIFSAMLNVDFDDAFVIYLNGVEIARNNIGETGTPPFWDQPAFKEHEAVMYQGMYPENTPVEPAWLDLILANGMNVLAVEVHNVQYNSSDLTCLVWLTFGIKDNSVLFSTPPSWFNGGKSFLHTNFKLNGDGENVYLYTPAVQLLNVLTFPYTQIDNSYGCYPDGITPLVFFGMPTPNESNGLAQPYSGYAYDPVFSLPAGFYFGQQTLTLSTTFPGAQIRYTLDGSTPKDNSTLYSSSLLIDTTKVVRARVFALTALPSDVVTKTYFINEKPTLPVISMSTDPPNLFDWFEGIYVLGPNADTIPPYFGANFWQEWEKPANFEYFDKQKTLQLSQVTGIEIFGNYSRSNPQKSFKVVASGRYGPTSLDYNFFPDKNISSFKQIAIRNAGNDWNQLHFRDALAHHICIGETNLDVQAHQPALLYINGEYWGVYNIREKINKYYIENNHGVDPDSIDLMQYNGYVMDGEIDDLYNFAMFVFNNDFTDTANYNTLKNWLDVDNFIDYFAVETWSENGDWLPNNVRYWRERKAGAKWRHILWDLDFFGTMWWWPFTANSLDTNMNKTVGPMSSFQSILFDKLVANTEFRHNFINRYADLLNTLLTPKNLTAEVYAFRDSIDPEMPRHFKRWGDGNLFPWFGNNGQGTYDSWRDFNVPQIIFFINYRQVTARDHLQTTFSLKQQVPLTLDVYPPGAGTIQINTVQIDTFPWGGVYFDSVPITITAIPKPGYQFAFWQSNKLIPSPDFNSSVKINVDTFDVFTAYFFGSPDTDRVAINEINYNSDDSADAGDWVEIHNYGTTDVDISGWVFKDGNNANAFVIPTNTQLNSGEYLVLCGDSALFQAQHPAVANYIGQLNFGFSITGEDLRLFDGSGNALVSVNYSSSSPWPSDPNGSGKTLELLNPFGNSNDASNWFSGCIGGSPGGPFLPCPVGTEEFDVPGMVCRVQPNPVAGFATFFLTLSEPGRVQLTLIDVAGKSVITIMDERLEAREYAIPYNFSRNSPGVYFYQVATSKGRITKQVEKVR
ncbi:MAG: CotH kinase family protein [Bacteroidetes bacterium]|nr:CotH kinase family protein [Bacteroidota bacterium]